MEKRKGIFFDIGWTLMRPKREWFLTDLFYSLVPEADKYQSKIEQAMVSAMWILDQNHRMDTLEQEETQFRQFYSSLLSAIPELKLGDDAAVALAHDKVYNYQNYVFFPDAVPVLSDLKTEYKIGIISDTHGLLRTEVLDILQSCDCIFHAGDVDRPELLDTIRSLGALYVVRGNNDGYWAQNLRRSLNFTVGNVKSFMVHDRKDVAWELGDTQVVIFGHSHQYFAKEIDGRLWLNPGSCGRSRFGGDVTMAVMTVENGSWQVEKIVL